MGKRGRERRKRDKKAIRELKNRGYKYREYDVGSDGELVKPKFSKAEHRRRQAQWMALRWHAEIEIVEIISKQARDDIQAVEDARVFGVLDGLANGPFRQASFEQLTRTGQQGPDTPPTG